MSWARSGSQIAPSGSADRKVSRIVTQCIYDIGTGAWSKGHRLPSIREAETLFRAHQLTILRAYQELVRLGLVRSVPRSGFFVAESGAVRRVTTHQPELERLYEDFAMTIRRDTGLSPLGVLRYLAHLAESRAAQEPECAFVECTLTQSQSHADEISTRLGIPCLALTIAEIGGARARIPRSVHTLITTSFHIAELADLRKSPDLVVTDVSIQSSPRTVEPLRGTRMITIISLDLATAERMARDARALLAKPETHVGGYATDVAGLDGLLAELLGDPADATDGGVVLSPSLWEAVPRRWGDHPTIVPLRYSIRESAWAQLGDALGLPVYVTACDD